MTFDNGTCELLSAPLDRAHVKSREQGRTNVSYIEGWHVIAEANRIFGFDGWTRETVAIDCVSERPRKIGEGKTWEKDGFGVTYTAKVRVVAGGVVREGVGAGHGIDADPGQAHESAIKEAETDAMKRALMTFGNPFGLALYDKSQTNVADKPVPPPPTKDEICDQLKACVNMDELVATWSSHQTRLAEIKAASASDYAACVRQKDEMKTNLTPVEDLERAAIQGEAA